MKCCLRAIQQNPPNSDICPFGSYVVYSTVFSTRRRKHQEADQNGAHFVGKMCRAVKRREKVRSGVHVCFKPRTARNRTGSLRPHSVPSVYISERLDWVDFCQSASGKRGQGTGLSLHRDGRRLRALLGPSVGFPNILKAVSPEALANARVSVENRLSRWKPLDSGKIRRPAAHPSWILPHDAQEDPARW